MFITRTISGIALVAIIVSTGLLGGPVFALLITALALIGLFEFNRMATMEKSVFSIAGSIMALLMCGAYYFGQPELGNAMIVLAILIFMTIYVLSYPKYEAKQIFTVATGWMYAVVLVTHLLRIRLLPDGTMVLWLVFLGSWGSDTCAYCVGCLIGKHKAFPKLSPKKSVEGCIGGAVGAALVCGIYAVCMNRFVDGANAPVFGYVILGLAASVISQIGDLAASAMKRNFGIKDYGKLIPGHGGVLDRFDSIFFTAPLIYYAAVIFFK